MCVFEPTGVCVWASALTNGMFRRNTAQTAIQLKASTGRSNEYAIQHLFTHKVINCPWERLCKVTRLFIFASGGYYARRCFKSFLLYYCSITLVRESRKSLISTTRSQSSGPAATGTEALSRVESRSHHLRLRDHMDYHLLSCQG